MSISVGTAPTQHDALASTTVLRSEAASFAPARRPVSNAWRQLRIAASSCASLLLFTACSGASTTTVTRNGTTTQTVAESNTLAIAIITAATALVSAAATAFAGHVFATRRERRQTSHAESVETDRLLRQCVERVSTAVANCIAITHRASAAAASQIAVHASQTYDDGTHEVQAARDAALADIYLLPDDELREKALEAIDLYGSWLDGSSNAMVNGIEQPPTEPVSDARDAYFSKARSVLTESAVRVRTSAAL